MGGILEAFLAGKEARRVADANAQIGAMNAFIGQNGAALMGGDQNAMAQLAGFGPQGLEMAMGMQDRQTAAADRAYNRARQEKADARADEEWKLKIEEHKRSITAEQAAAEAAQAEQAAKMALTATSPEQWDQLAQQNGAPELVGQFENREAIAAQFMSVAEVLKSTNPDGPEWRAASPEEAAKYGAAAGQINDKTGEFKKSGDGNGVTYTTTNPDGTSTTVQVGGNGKSGAGGKPLTESQAKLTVFQTDMVQAAEVLTELESKYDPTNMQDALATGILGDKWGSFLQSGEGQIYKSAAFQWLDSGIRIRTGAAATEGEVARQFASMFPQPGDTKETVAYKRRARENFQRSVDAALKGVQDPVTPAAPDDMFTPSDAAKPAKDMSDDEYLQSLGLE